MAAADTDDRHDGHGSHHEKLVQRKREAELRKKRQTMLGFASVGAVLLGGAIGTLIWMNKSAAEAGAARNRLAAQDQVVAELLGYDKEQPEAIARMLERAKATHDLWSTSLRAGEIGEAVHRAETTLAALQDKQKLVNGLAAIERELPSASTREQLEQLHRQIAELLPRLAKAAPDIQSRAKGLEDRVDQSLCSVLAAAAAALGAAPPSQQNLEECRRVEDVLHSVIADAKNLEPTRQQELTVKLKEVVATTDKIAIALAQPGSESPWNDIGAAAVADWHASATPGFSVAASGGELTISGPNGDQKGTGLAVLQKHGPYRDCEIDLQCQLDSGAATIFLRLGRKAERKLVPVVDLTTGQPGKDELAIAAGQPVTLHVRVLGSTLEVRGEGAVTGTLQHPIPIGARAGSIGIATSPGTRMHIKHLAVRNLP